MKVEFLLLFKNKWTLKKGKPLDISTCSIWFLS